MAEAMIGKCLKWIPALECLIEQIDNFVPRFQVYELPSNMYQSKQIMMEGLRVLRSAAKDLLNKFTIMLSQMEGKRKMDAIAVRVQSATNMRNQVQQLLSEIDELLEEFN